MKVSTVEELRQLYPAPKERAVKKELRALDSHCRRFIELSPFVVLATSDRQNNLDASPRGGTPGFVRVDASGALLLPDSPGNNRLDSLENILVTGRAGLLFFIPGIDETLRVNGRAELSRDEHHISLCSDERRNPKVVIRIVAEAVYFHCAKAFLRSRLWHDDGRLDRNALPTLDRIVSDQTGTPATGETREDMEKRYASEL